MYEEDIRDEEMLFEEEYEEDEALVETDDEEKDGNDFYEELEEDDELIEDEDDDEEDVLEDETEEKIPQTVKAGGIGCQIVNRGALQIDVDIVMVIDCTGSMGPLLKKVKKTALSFYKQVRDALGAKSRRVRRMRVKVIAYRDYYCDWADPEHPPMLISDFFSLPDEEEAFAEFINALEDAGGEDDPESALEALHHAFHSDWMVDPTINKRRQIIVVFTDAPAHKLNDPRRYVHAEHNGEYPEEGMPTTLEELQAEYSSPDVFPAEQNGAVKGHRLILFAPSDMYPWNEMQQWEAANCETMDPKTGLENIDMEAVVNLVGGSIG